MYALALWVAAGEHLYGAQNATAISLRGYGKVEAHLGAQSNEFLCESPEKADILLGKLLADMFWDAGAAHIEKSVSVGGHDVTIHVWGPFGAAVAGRAGSHVLIAGGGNEQETLDLVRKDARFASRLFQSKPSNPYPAYLDFFDLRAFKSNNSYVLLKDLNKMWPAAKQLGFTGITGDLRFAFTPADGVVDWSGTDYHVAAAEREKSLLTMKISTGQWPRWAWNAHPDYIGQMSSHSVLDWSIHGQQLNEGLGLTPDQRQMSLQYLRDAMVRYRNSPALGGWELYVGDYIFETYFMKDYQGLLDYSPTGLEGFRRWLRETRRYSLKDLGERWYGEPRHFNGWNEVRLFDDINGFFGDLNESSLHIREGWRWKKAEAADVTAPKEDDPGWVPFEMPPAKYMFMFPKPGFYKVTFDPAEWLKKNPGKDVYLVCNINAAGWQEYPIWLNGDALGTFKSKIDPYNGPIALKLTGLLRAGRNLLVVRSADRIHGPIFLTTTKPVRYPYWGQHRNAQYLDMLEWQLDALNSKVSSAMEFARRIDPDKPFVLSATGLIVKDGQGEALSRFGGTMHDTGYEASYRPFDMRFGYAGGFYGDCEPSATPFRAEDLQTKNTTVIERMLGWMLINGEGSVNYLGSPLTYLELEEQTGWFSKNKRLIQLVGKYLPEKPKIAIFFSSQNLLLGGSMAEWDIGRGELHAAHYDNVYVSESMLAKGIADEYPVLFDSGTLFMGQDTVEAIRRYVEKGGTFVALHDTGQHGLLDADSWPMGQLTGFKAVATSKKGKIRFEKNLPLFRGWEGKEFEGEGSSLDWKDTESAKDVSLGLRPSAKDAIALARWEDGTVAVGMRPIGKGRVMVLGSTFWRSGRDLGGSGMWRTQDVERTFFESLFKDLGVQRSATASTPLVYTRKFITKNGLEEWLGAFNTMGADLKADVSFAVSQKPDQLLDMATEKPVAFEYADGWVKVKEAAISGYGVRIFGVRRSTLAGGVLYWWGEKTKFWRSPEIKPSAEVKPLVETGRANQSSPATIRFESWKFYADKDNSAGKSDDWTRVSFDDRSWRKSAGRPWDLAYSDLRDFVGTGLYRSIPFSIPRSWEGRDLEVAIVPSPGMWLPPDEFYLNGRKIAGLAKPKRAYVVTDMLRKDGNVLSVKVTADKFAASRGGGLYFAIWLRPKRTLAPSISLLGDWQAVMGDWLSRQPASLPGKVKAKYIVREFEVPEQWRGRNVYVSFSPGLQNACIMLNGQAAVTTPGLDSQDINLTPFIKFGQKNRIEIWPQNTFWLNSTKGDEEGIIDLTSIEIGCEK